MPKSEDRANETLEWLSDKARTNSEVDALEVKIKGMKDGV